MRFVKYAGIVVGVLIVFVLVLIGVLSVTRGTPVKQVIAEGDRGGPPTVSDTLFPRTIESVAGASVTLSTGACTFTSAESTTPMTVCAMMYVEPCDGPAVTAPVFGSTVAMLGSFDVNASRNGEIGWPPEPVPVTVNPPDAPALSWSVGGEKISFVTAASGAT